MTETLQMNLSLEKENSKTVVYPIKILQVRTVGGDRIIRLEESQVKEIRYPMVRLNREEAESSRWSLDQELRSEREKQEEWRRSQSTLEQQSVGENQKFEVNEKSLKSLPFNISNLSAQNIKKMALDMKQKLIEKGSYVKKTVDQYLQNPKYKQISGEVRNHSWTILLVMVALIIFLI